VTSEMRLDDIVIDGRFRKDMGDLQGLADDIDDIGLIQPVVVTPANKLIAGGRRVEAVKLLGWDTIPVTVIHTLADATDALKAECSENTFRKDFTPTEAAAIRDAIAEAIRPLAEERKAEGNARGGKGEVGGNLPPTSAPTKTRDVAAKGTGYSGKTLDKVDKVIAVAHDKAQPEDVRETAREALAEMDNTAKVDGSFRKAMAAIKKQPPTPEQLAAHHETEKLMAEQETLNRWSRAVDSLTNALSYAKTFTPPAIPANHVSIQEFKARLAALVEISNQWKEEN
jgi:ParB family transcriptional regulator, chromosome partitioning protein